MKDVSTIGLDLAKHVFQVHGANAEGSPVFNRKLRRGEVLCFFEKLPPCLVGMEACGTAHYWAREIAALGHEVRLIPPAYVKPFVKRGKTDAADAEAIGEAVTRKTMRFVPVKTARQQAATMAEDPRSSGAAANSGGQRSARSSGGIGHYRRRRHGEGCSSSRDRARRNRCPPAPGSSLCPDGCCRSDRRPGRPD